MDKVPHSLHSIEGPSPRVDGPAPRTARVLWTVTGPGPVTRKGTADVDPVGHGPDSWTGLTRRLHREYPGAHTIYVQVLDTVPEPETKEPGPWSPGLAGPRC